MRRDEGRRIAQALAQAGQQSAVRAQEGAQLADEVRALRQRIEEQQLQQQIMLKENEMPRREVRELKSEVAEIQQEMNESNSETGTENETKTDSESDDSDNIQDIVPTGNSRKLLEPEMIIEASENSNRTADAVAVYGAEGQENSAV